MPRVRKAVGEVTPLLMMGSDLHLSHDCPSARMCEEDWYAAMGRVLAFLELKMQQRAVHLVLAGDVFHHYRQPPELLNYLAEHMPKGVWSVYGQHDLPFHNENDLHKSAYHTMMKLGKLNHMHNNVRMGECYVWPFGWGKELHPISPNNNCINIAVCHHYVWANGHVHPGAREEDYVENIRKQLRGFDVAVFGDNHSKFQSFTDDPELPHIFNTGCMMRRRMDEAEWQPSVLVLNSDLSVEELPIPLEDDCMAHDKLTTVPPGTAVIDAAELLQDLRDEGYVGQDFCTALRMVVRFNKDLSHGAATILNEVLEEMEKQGGH